ncbi:hypothetical protein GCM10020254_30230 [Streptomyces goshikiensis]
MQTPTASPVQSPADRAPAQAGPSAHENQRTTAAPVTTAEIVYAVGRAVPPTRHTAVSSPPCAMATWWHSLSRQTR